MRTVCVHPNRIVTRPYTLKLQHGDRINNGTRVMLDPLHQCDARGIPHGEFNFAVQLDKKYPFNHPDKPDHLISQWRQEGSPYLSLHHAGGEWYFKAGDDRIDCGVASICKTDFEISINWAETNKGKLQIIRDGNELYSERIQTIASDKKVHWTIGDYRPWWNDNPLWDGEPASNTIKVWL